jgi:ABC-type transporter Mla MlaB component
MTTDRAVQNPGESARLEWRGECCIEAITLQHEQLLKALEEGMPVEVDLGDVSRIDTSGLQLLLSFVLEMQRRGQKVGFPRVSEVVVQAAKNAGVLELLST